MQKKFLFFIIFIMLFSLTPAVFASDYVQRQLMVTIANSGTKLSEMPEAEAKNVIAGKAAEVAKACGGTAKCFNEISISQNKIVAVITSKAKTTEEMQAICNARSDVLSAKPNRIYKKLLSVTPQKGYGSGNANGENSVAGNGSTVDDPLFPDQWALCGAHGLNAADIWKLEKGSADVVIAVVDTGVDFSHEDLAENMAVLKKTERVTIDNAKQFCVVETYIGYARVDEDKTVWMLDERPVEPEDNLPMGKAFGMADVGVPSGTDAYKDLEVVPDTMGHGSRIASIIAAVTNNGVGMAGLANGCKIAAFNFTGVEYAANNPEKYKNVPCGYLLGSDSIECDVWNEVLAQKKAGLNIRVANVSYANWQSWPPEADDALFLALKAVSDADIIICVSAGNDAQNLDNTSGEHKGELFFPACYKMRDPSLNIIVTGATNDTGEYADYSNYGAKSVDIAAPGTQLYGAVSGYQFGRSHYDAEKELYYVSAIKNDTQYEKASGTSFASPCTAAAAALLCSRYPDKSAEEIIKLIYDNADTKFKGTETTYGNLNIVKALTSKPQPEPTPSGSSGGCNGGFGAIALLAVTAMPLGKQLKRMSKRNS